MDSITQSVTLEGVEIKGTKYTSNIKSHANGQISVDLKLLSNLPQILGHADPIHYSQMLPEIQTNGELRGGVNIQGSESSHNLVSIDEVPIYNVSHLLGFFSTFNSSHFSSFSLRKMNDAQSPNRIGGELSMKHAYTIPDTLSGEFSAGLISSQGTLRLPLSKNTSLTTSVRSSYVNLLYSRWLKSGDIDIDYAFSDFNLTLLHKINEHNDVLIDYYGGFDKGAFSDQSYTAKMKADWGNQMAAVHHHYKKDNLQINNTAYLTYYKNNLGFTMQDVNYKLPSSILDLGIRHKGEWKRVSWGADFILHDIKPQSLSSSGTITSNAFSEPSVTARELSVFASYNVPVTAHVLCKIGVRGNMYDSKNSDIHLTVDPSLNLSYSKGNVELSVGYSLKHQYLFQTGFSDAGLPTEFWLPADNRYHAQYAHSVNVGASIYLLSRRFKVESNIFYKKLFNQMEYMGSIFDFVNANYDLTNHQLLGKGQNYGFSIILNKCSGKLSGWMSYTYTHAKRTFPTINPDKAFSPSHERPHEMNAVVTYSLGRHWDFGGTFVYASGTPFTAVSYLTMINGNIISHYGEYNGSRLHPYCRFDVSVNYKWKSRFAKECGINLSLYNMTSRDNELFYYISTDKDGKFSYRPKSFFVDILPSISYFCKF